MATKRFTDADYAEMAAMREAGSSPRAIAEKFDCSVGFVNWTCLRLFADAPDAHKKLVTRNNPPLVRRGAHTVRGFTPEEDAILLEMEASETNYALIGRRLGRTRNSILGRLLTLARRDARAELREEETA